MIFYDSSNHGEFTKALIRGLSTPGLTKGEKQGMFFVFLCFVFVALL